MTRSSFLSAGSSQPQVGVRTGHRNCKASHFFGDSLKDRQDTARNGGLAQQGTVIIPAPQPHSNLQTSLMAPILLTGKPRHRSDKTHTKS